MRIYYFRAILTILGLVTYSDIFTFPKNVWNRFLRWCTTTEKDRVCLCVPGDFSLHIYPVELEDDGTYQCQASPTNDGQPALRSRFAKLSVLVPPQKPKILQGDFLITTEDRELVIECVSVAGKPPAEVSLSFLFYFEYRLNRMVRSGRLYEDLRTPT